MNVSVQNLEEASLLASEFISSIDNLPNEVQHLLQEIRHKDSRSQDLLQELSRDQARFIRDSSAPASNNASPASDSPSSYTPTSAIPPPTHLLPTKVTQTYSQLTQLADEKLLLAQKIIDIIIKSKARLDFDLAKVRTLHGESTSSSTASLTNPPLVGGDPIILHPVVNSSALGGASNTAPPGSAYAGRGHASTYTSGANTPVFSADSSTTTTLIGENIRNAILLAPDVLPLSPAATAAAMASATASNTKRRKLASSTNSIKLPSPAPHHHHPRHHSSTPTSRSRLSRQLRVPITTHSIDDDDDDLLHNEIGARSGGGGESLLADIDAEGDEDLEGEDAEDSTLYCFCQKPGAGEMMIGCDNSSCPYQWFHISCVGVKQPLPDKWYCQECKSKGAGAPTRKGRKKAS